MKKLFIFLLSLILIGCVSSTKINPIKTPLNINNWHKTVFIDNDFTLSQTTQIINALNNWECSTNNQIRFDIHSYTPDMNYSEIYAYNNPLFIMKVPDTDERIVKAGEDLHKRKPKNNIVGLYIMNDITSTILIVNTDYLDFNIKPITIHEIGHSLGIDHSDNTNSIMYDTISEGAKKITQNDLIALCNLYWCDASKFKSCN